MDLDTFMKMKKLTNPELARQVGSVQSSIRLYRMKKRNPPLGIARKLMIISKGLINLEDLIRPEDL